MLKVELEVARDKMTSIKQVQFLRTPDEREQQIREQSKVIQELELKIAELPTKLEVINQDIEMAGRELRALRKD
jgi:hypothetical protein